jgi:hypothetical protein
MRGWAWLWLPVVFFVMCAGWALTSPPGSSPDDDYHLSSIWCAAGIEQGRCEEVPGQPLQRAVPAAVVGAASCFAFEPATSAACARPVPSGMTATDRVNETAGLYPVVYYRAMSVFVGPDVERSVVMMRLANITLAALLMLLLLRVVPAGIRHAALLAVTVTFIPLGLFVVASTNPSGWAVVGLTFFWAFALSLLHRRDWRNRRTWLIAAATVICGVMAAGARVDAAAFVVVAAVLAGILAGPTRMRVARASVAVVAAVALFGAATFLLRGSPLGDVETMGTADQGLGLLLTNAAYLPILFLQAVGGGALGWNDTVLPPYVMVMGVLALGAVAYAGVSLLDRRKAVASVVALLALVLVPLAFLQREGLAVGEVVQPRYVLPLLALLLAVVCLGPRPGVALELARTPSVLLAIGLSLSAILAFWTNAHRYFAGTGVGLFDPKVVPAWLSSVGPHVWLTTLVSGAASITFVVGVLVVMRRSAQRG